ncbi:hypothetical protein BGZ65_011922, partial [Modicella reniformis]
MDPDIRGDTTTCTGTSGPAETSESTATTTTTAIPTTTTATTSTSAAAAASTEDDASPPNSPKDEAAYPHHVIFVVHGMGRQLEEHGAYERNVAYLVENTKTVLQSTYHDLKTDVHIIPTEWHAKLHTLVDDRMSLTALKTVPK